MKFRLVLGLMLSLAMGISFNSSALADKLLCISKEHLKGEETVGECVAKGGEFAIQDDQGKIRSIGPQEMEALKRYRPEIFKMKAYGLKCEELAPKIPRPSILIEPKIIK